jgi:hypothetical protein
MKKSSKSLEEISLWYRYKTDIWNTKTPQANTTHNIMRTLRSIYFPEGLIYVSTPITSGKNLYLCQLKDRGLKKDKFIKNVIDHNYLKGYELVEEFKMRMGCPILFPADLIPAHQKWDQKHFMALWLSIIAEKATMIVMNKTWEYANGSAEEFVHVMQLRLGIPTHRDLVFFNTKEDEREARKRMREISVLDHNGDRISLNRGYRKIQKAVIWIKSNGFKAKRLETCLELLEKTEDMIREEFYQ